MCSLAVVELINICSFHISVDLVIQNVVQLCPLFTWSLTAGFDLAYLFLVQQATFIQLGHQNLVCPNYLCVLITSKVHIFNNMHFL